MEKIIEVKSLYKAYGQVKAVDGIDFYVEKGKLFAFLGPNGAGKSTTIDIICTLLKADQGEILIDGKTIGKEDDEIRKQIGVVFQDSVLDKRLTVYENLKSRGSMYKIKAIDLKQKISEVALEVGITDLLKRRYGTLSGGQRRRVDIARALIHTPKILFLDEPTTGLDPQTRQNVWETIKRLQVEKNVTVFLTTHYMEEANEADYVIVIDHGKIAAKGTPGELKEKYAKDYLRMKFTKDSKLIETIKNLKIKYTLYNDTVKIFLDDTLAALTILEKCNGQFSSFEVLTGNMDDVFIGVTGREIRE